MRNQEALAYELSLILIGRGSAVYDNNVRIKEPTSHCYRHRKELDFHGIGHEKDFLCFHYLFLSRENNYNTMLVANMHQILH